MTCSSCETGIDHCHGTLVEHASGVVECTDAGCVSFGIERHLLVIECDEVVGGCGCGQPSGALDPDAAAIYAADPDGADGAMSQQLLRAS